ncbi:MAG: aerobic carbon-monoxide dehydrogenase large subunit [Betaproteobacteria bacterium]|nr:aerobic carbon-monoxide dehydrogenase large subunit [Betaproteobacteria bacterium]
MEKWIGQPLPRKEDDRLLSGRGNYTADLTLPGEAHACVVRSPHAHARIRAINVELPGVLAVLTGREAAADGLQPIPFRPISPNPHEVPLKGKFLAPYPVLPLEYARFVGEAVAIVVAETHLGAKDAAERLEIDYEALDAVTDTLEAARPGAPRVWSETDNVCVDSEAGDPAAVAAAFARAAYIVRFDTQLNRVTGVPLEPRITLAAYEDGRYTLYTTSGWVQRHRADLATVLGVPENAVRVVTRELGGNYGTRNNFYPEYALAAWAARRVGRPVKCALERHECFLSDDHSRDLAVQAELALDREGNFLALRSVNTSNLGAHALSMVPLSKGMGVSTSVYRLPAAAVRGRAVLSNTTPTSAYRAAGRPEVMFVIERLIDLAARRHGFDRLALRKRNLVPAAAMPYRNPFGLVYDSGDYAAAQDRAAAAAGWHGFEARRAEARRRGRYRGIGLANYVELNTGAPREQAEITVRPEGRIDLVLGTLSSGQGHETSFAQLIADWFSVEPSQVRLLAGDSDVAKIGGGTHSGRSMRMGAAVMRRASDLAIEQGRQNAADVLEAAAADIEFAAGRFSVKGTDRSVGLFELGALKGVYDESTPLPSFAYGCGVCEVEIDPETGEVEVVAHTNVDDCGRAINPLILHGQAHGGMAAGIGEALLEHCRYEPGTGQLQTATLMDYALPRADMLPMFTTEISEVPSTTHPLGLRGGGEGGTTPALGAVANAIADALAPLGVEHVELPATPERVWRAIQQAK